MTKKLDITFNVLDWNSKDDIDEDDEENENFIIECYGKTIDEKSVYLRITEYTPYFFVEIPKRWKEFEIKKFMYYVNSKVYGKYQNSIISYDVVKKHKLYGFTAGKRFKFIRLVFNTNTAMKKYSWIFTSKHKIYGLENNQPTKYQIYESNIPPMLRFMHIRDINACGWLKVSKYSKLPKGEYNTKIAIEARWMDVIGLEDTSICKIKIASFDLECTSGDGSFPQATRKSDKIIQIGTTFSYNGDEECYFKHIITLGSCAPIEGATVESYDDECDVILAWQKMINKQDPDIITGYNIYGFDNKYLHDRAVYLGIEDEFGKFSRIKNYKCDYIDTQLSSSALGDNKIRYYNTHGRIQIDLMKVVMKDYKLNSYKLDSVAEEFLKGKVINFKGINLEVDKTDDLRVNGYIKLIDSDDELVEDGKKYKILEINDKMLTLDKEPVTDNKKLTWTLAKDDVKPTDIFRLQKGDSQDRKIIAEYCIQDCALVNKLMARLCVVINSIGMANVCIVPLSFLFFRGQGIKITSLVAKDCRQMNYLMPLIKKDENEENQGYEGATVFPPKIGFYKRPIAVLDYASLYPSSMIHKNISHETFVDNAKYDNHPDYIYYDCKYKNGDGSFTECRYAKNKDGTMGIMPMIETKLLKQRKAVKKLMGKEEDYFLKSIYDGLQLAYKITANSLYGQTGARTSSIYLKPVAASITSTGREMLELARDYMENVFPEIMYTLYEAFTTDDKEKIDLILKEELVEELHTKEFIDDLKEKIVKILNKCTIKPDTVYGDTDSVFIDFGFKIDGEYYEEKEALEFAIDMGVIAGNFIKMKMHKPQDLEYEKTFYPFCILSKKRYVGNKYEFDKNKFKQNSMGIVLKRRDNARIVKKIVGGMVDILFNEVDIEKAVNFIKGSIVDLLKGKYPLHNFVTSKTLKGRYKGEKLSSNDKGKSKEDPDYGGKKGEKGEWYWHDVKCAIAHVKLSQRMRSRDEGSAPSVNERVQYAAIVVENEKNVLQGDRIEHPDYIVENNLRVDYLFYLTNQIKNPTVQFLELLVDDPNIIFDEAIQMETNKRKGNVSIDTFFKVKNKTKNLETLKIKKKPKNVMKFYLNDDENLDLEKIGIDKDKEVIYNNNSEDSESEIKTIKKVDKYKKLFLDLSI